MLDTVRLVFNIAKESLAHPGSTIEIDKDSGAVRVVDNPHNKDINGSSNSRSSKGSPKGRLGARSARSARSRGNN